MSQPLLGGWQCPPAGDILAGAVFCFAFSVFLATVRRELCCAGLALFEPMADGWAFSIRPPCRGARDPGAACVDDVAFCAESAAPHLVPGQLRQMADLM